MRTKTIVIFDLDETLCDTQHRIHHMKKQGFEHEKYNSLHYKDDVYKDAQYLYKLMERDIHTTIYISTARPCGYLDSTHDWLFKNDLFIPISRVYMRPEDDTSSDKKIKAGNLKMIRNYHPLGTPVVAFEDRDSVIEMYRNQGVTALQIRKGEY